MKLPRGIIPSSLAIMMALTGALTAQQLGELDVTPVPEGEGINYIVRNLEQAILIVHSSLPDLSFESNVGVISVDRPAPGEFLVHLNPGTSIITFKAEGYQIYKERYYIPPKSYQEVRVRVKIPAAEERGGIRIETDPPGASVTFNNIPLPQKTPLTLENQPAGLQPVRLELDGYAVLDTLLRVDKGVVSAHRLTLRREYAGLKVTSDPIGATVYLDGESLGMTPLERADLTPGEGTLLVELSGYVTNTQPVRLKGGETAPVNLFLVPQTGAVEVTTEPAGAEVWLDDQPLGTYQGTPLVKDKLRLGMHSVRAARGGYDEATQSIGVDFNRTTKVKLSLTGKEGALFVSSTPSGASIIIDGRETGKKTNSKVSGLTPGSHNLSLRLGGYTNHDAEVMVTEDRTNTVNAVMEEETTAIQPSKTFYPSLNYKTQMSDISIESKKRDSTLKNYFHMGYGIHKSDYGSYTQNWLFIGLRSKKLNTELKYVFDAGIGVKQSAWTLLTDLNLLGKNNADASNFFRYAFGATSGLVVSTFEDRYYVNSRRGQLGINFEAVSGIKQKNGVVTALSVKSRYLFERQLSRIKNLVNWGSISWSYDSYFSISQSGSLLFSFGNTGIRINVERWVWKFVHNDSFGKWPKNWDYTLSILFRVR